MLELDYDKGDTVVTTQDLLFSEPVSGLRIAGRAFYGSVPGFELTAGIQYVHATKTWFLLLSARADLEKASFYAVFFILQLNPTRLDKARLSARCRGLTVVSVDSHNQSYQWAQLALYMGGKRFGIAVNFVKYGSEPALELSVGLFVRRETF